MSGRTETDEKYREKTKKLLEGKNEIIKDYFYCFRDRTEMTRYHYMRHVIDFLDYLKEEEKIEVDKEGVNKILPIHINKYFEYKQVSNSSLKAVFSALNNFFDYLCANKYIDKDPCYEVSRPRSNDENEIVFMNPDEINQIIEKIKKDKRKKFINRDQLIFGLGYTTALRATSIIEINISDIDFDNKFIKVVTKGNMTRKCNLSENIINLIKEWINDRKDIVKGNTDALFISSVGKRMSYQALYKVVKKHTQNLTKNISPHKMRSSCATNLYAATNDIYLVQNVLGHKKIENTRRYAKVSEHRIKDAVEKLDNMIFSK